MEMKAGYKETEAGVIPREWESKTLGDLFGLRNGFAFSSAFFSKSGPIVLTPGNFRLNGGLYFDDGNTKRYSGPYDPSMRFNKGDLLIVMTDLTPECNLLGKPAFVHSDEVILHNQRIGKVLIKDRSIKKDYLFYVLLSRPYLARLRELATGSTVRHTSNKSIYSVWIPLPTLREQGAISEALGDVDTLIGGLDKLIVKKRALKQAAMQQLLTGKQRLPGFHGDWENKRLGDIFSISAGKSKSQYISNAGKYWVIDMGAVSTEGKLLTTKPTNYQGDFLNVGDLVMPKDDIGGGNIIGRVAYIDRDRTYVLGDHVYVLRAKLGWSPFLSFMINGDKTNLAFRKKAIGSAQLGLSRKSVAEQEIPFPHVDEQVAIANVLSDMDSEIVALEQRRDKTRALKQGMMQELLTGKTRLI